jgi:hypothetical protein
MQGGSAGDWFGQQGVSGYQPSTGGYAPQGDMNQAGAGSDPFSYTNGSLLTPWTQKFSAPAGSGGGYTPPQLSNFNFGAFTPTSVGRFGQAAPEATKYADFVAPDAQTFKQDPGYQFRLQQGQQALENSAAARGTLLTGGTAKALSDYGQASGSQEYGNAFNRALTGYNTNKDTSQQYFGNQMQSFGGNLAGFQANTTAALGEGQLQGQAWDRNYGLARTQWQDQADAANRAASASAGNSAQSYDQALQQYKMEHDIFQENQSNQYNRIRDQQGLGMQAAAMQGGYGSSYGANAGNIYGQMGNALAAGQVGASNAWGNALTGAVNGGLGAYYANQNQGWGGPAAYSGAG